MLYFRQSLEEEEQERESDIDSVENARKFFPIRIIIECALVSMLILLSLPTSLPPTLARHVATCPLIKIVKTVITYEPADEANNALKTHQKLRADAQSHSAVVYT